LALESDNFLFEFNTAVNKGDQVLEEPFEQPWGVTTAYLQGPEDITFELEERTKNQQPHTYPFDSIR